MADESPETSEKKGAVAGMRNAPSPICTISSQRLKLQKRPPEASCSNA